MKYKSISKTVTYRVFSITVTIVLLRIFFDSWLQIGLYTVVSQSIKTFGYWIHEYIYKIIKRKRLIKDNSVWEVVDKKYIEENK